MAVNSEAMGQGEAVRVCTLLADETMCKGMSHTIEEDTYEGL